MTYDPTKFYVWQAPGKLVTIHLSLDVIDRLNQARAEFEGDISAVLLGYSMIAPQTATFVDDFVLLPESWDLKGGTYSAELEVTRAEIVRKLADGAENGRHAIGFSRWQQEGPLELTGGDFAAAQRFFAETDNILLLVRSLPYQVGEAALFYWDDGKLQVPEPSSHFPFQSDKLSIAGREPVSSRRRAHADALPPVPPAPPRRRIWPESTGEPIRWLRLLPLAGLLSIGIAAAELVFDHDRPTAQHQPAAVAQMNSAPATAPAAAAAPTNPVPPTAPIEEAKLGLRVTSRPKQLEIHWNHDAKAILAATKGLMRITDGNQTEVIEFEPHQLQDGAVAYTPATNDVNIRFEVSGADGGSTVESIRAVAIP
jgi:hypothetical protein